MTPSLAQSVDWPAVKAVIFDVDGTLYAQRPLRRKMLLELAAYYALRPWHLRELQLLSRFRTEREHRAGTSCAALEQAQYEWVARTPAQVARLRQVVDTWIFRRPNRHLASCAYPGVADFFAALRQRGIKIGIYSDYPAQQKLQALGLRADVLVSSTDAEVNALKPQPQGLRRAAEALGVPVGACLFLGDRPELDGRCAELAGMPCLLLDPHHPAAGSFYPHLTTELHAIIPATL